MSVAIALVSSLVSGSSLAREPGSRGSCGFVPPLPLSPASSAPASAAPTSPADSITDGARTGVAPSVVATHTAASGPSDPTATNPEPTAATLSID